MTAKLSIPSPRPISAPSQSLDWEDAASGPIGAAASHRLPAGRAAVGDSIDTQLSSPPRIATPRSQYNHSSTLRPKPITHTNPPFSSHPCICLSQCGGIHIQTHHTYCTMPPEKRRGALDSVPHPLQPSKRPCKTDLRLSSSRSHCPSPKMGEYNYGHHQTRSQGPPAYSDIDTATSGGEPKQRELGRPGALSMH